MSTIQETPGLAIGAIVAPGEDQPTTATTPRFQPNLRSPVIAAWSDLHEQGLWVFPLSNGAKHPGELGIKWKESWLAKGRAPWPQLACAHFDAAGLWLATGQVSKRVVLDMDSAEAIEYWREKIGADAFGQALRVSNGNPDRLHLHFRIPPDDERPWPGWSHATQGIDLPKGVAFDVRGDGGGVVVPPSVHKSGRVYGWCGGDLLDAPECLRKPERPHGPREAAPARECTEPDGTAYGLAALAKELAKVRATVTGRTDTDVYTAARSVGELVAGGELSEDHARQALIEAIPTDEMEMDHALRKIEHGFKQGALRPRCAPFDNSPVVLHNKSAVRQVDGAEAGPAGQVVNATVAPAADDQQGGPMAGYLKSGDFEILHRTKGEDGEFHYKSWADFDLKATGVFVSADDLATGYAVQVRRKSDRKVSDDVLPIAALAIPSKLDAWLADRLLTIGAEGPTAGLAEMRPATRLARYLRSQNPETIRMTPHLGWSTESGSLLTTNGLIRPGVNELVPFGSTRPDPKTRSWATYSYGFVSEGEAVGVLREVLTHQDEAVATVFGAWWVMSMLKGQYQADLFPVVNIQAVKGSGKSRGFFAEMVAMSGYADGSGQFTPATLRDAIGSNRNGVVWVDDLTGIADALGDLIRQATAGGRRSKKEQDNSTSTSTRLVSSILVTGEGLGAANEDGALRDRFINLEIDPADKRTNPATGRLQWLDMQDLWAKYGGVGAEEDSLTAVAGTLAQMVLARAPMLAGLSELRTSGGRHQAKMSVLRMGARILDDLLGTADGEKSHADSVDAWVSSQVDLGAANLGLEVIVPWFLRSHLMPTTAVGHQGAFVDHDKRVWVAPERLADAWHARHNLTPRERQLGTEDAIRRELKGCDCTRTKVHDTNGGEDRKRLGRGQKRYVELASEVAERVLLRTGAGL